MSYPRKPGVAYLPPHVKERQRQLGPDVILPAGPHVREPVNLTPLETSYECLRCRRRLVLEFPLLAAQWVEQCSEFGDIHARCRP